MLPRPPICKSVNSNSANWKKILVLCVHPAPLPPSWQMKLDQHMNCPPKSSYCSGLVKNYTLCIHPSSSGVNASSTASSVAQCLHCNISGRNAIVNWKSKPWSGESRPVGAGAHSLLVPPLQSPSWHRARAQGDIPDAQPWIMDMPPWIKVYPMQLALGRNLFCSYKQAENSFNAVVESLLLLLILCMAEGSGYFGVVWAISHLFTKWRD